MLLPGVRLVARPGALHLFDGRRVVTLRGDEHGHRAIRAAIGQPDGADGGTALDSAAVAQARDLLVRLRLGVDEADTVIPTPLAAAFASASVAGWVSPREADARLDGVEVHVWDATDDAETSRAGTSRSETSRAGTSGGLIRALSESGLRCRALTGPEDIRRLDPQRSITAVVTGDERPATQLRAANDACLARGVTWLPVGAYDGAVVHVGPLMVPGQTACADCLLLRLAANVEYADVYGDIADAPAAPTPPALREWAFSIATLVLLRWIATRDVRLPGRLYTVDPDAVEIRQASVFRIPRCASCAAPDFVTAAAPWDIARDR
jgi:bacteriocin biosynthesis cyclodehydratase domain-containing protein